MLAKFVGCLVLLCAVALVAAENGKPFVVGLFQEDPFRDQFKNFTRNADRQLLRLTVINEAPFPREVDFQTYLPATAKLVSFSITHDDVTYHGLQVDLEKGHEIMKRAAEEQSSAAFFIPKSLEDYYDITNEQSSKNILLVNANSEAHFDLLYEDPPYNVDLNTQKFLTQVRTIVDLSATSSRNLTTEISSPNYPGSYPNSVDLTWWIHAPSNEIIAFRVVNLELEECCDRLTIYDGISNQYPVLGVLTGNGSDINNNKFMSSSNNLFVQFTSDCSLTMKGFRGILNTISTGHNPSYPHYPRTTASSLASCSGTEYLYVYPYSSYNLSSPGYPHQNHANNLNCAWRLQASSYSYVIKLEVLDLDLETCCDSVVLYDGSSSNYSPIVQLPRYGNSSSTFYSSGVYMYIQFRSDSSINRRGFHFKYEASYPPTTTTVSPDYTTSHSCTNNYQYHIYSYDYGYIRSPNYPYSYYSNCHQTWYIHQHSYNYVVQLQVQAFSLSYGDTVTIYDGSSSNYPILRTLTGSHGYTVIESTGTSIYVVFTSDSSYESSGFQLRYQSTYKTMTTNAPHFTDEMTTQTGNTCSGTSYLSAQRYQTRTIFSPGYPYSPNYGTYLNCYYQITCSYSYDIVRLEVVNMTIERYYDYLYLYNGHSSGYPLIASLTGTVRNAFYHSTQRYMTLRFTTNGRITSNDIGFEVNYMSLEPGQQTTAPSIRQTTDSINSSCEYSYVYVYSNDPKIITSPGYPQSHSNSLNCNWQIVGYQPYVIQLIMLDISLEQCCDEVRVYDGPSSSYSLLRRFTGSDTGVVYSTGYRMLVNFQTDSSVTYKGFQAVFALVYSQNCRIASTNSTIATRLLNGTEQLDIN